jgi:desulfoferrodoxin (superoxide reductase-like protein)
MPGISLPPVQAEEQDDDHVVHVEQIEDEHYVIADHPMTKEHFLSFFAAVSDQGVQLVKLYPEGNADARFKINRVKWIYSYCNRHGMFRIKL